jgi:hypothetical protein
MNNYLLLTITLLLVTFQAACESAGGTGSIPPVMEAKTMNIRVGSRNFTMVIYDNASARALLERLPLTITMSELNGNEKYYNLPNNLPSASQRLENIKTGDVMLYGSDCIVLFYKDFSTSYRYTRLGYIENPSGLADALGHGNVEVVFSVE